VRAPSAIPQDRLGAFYHFRQRVAERVSADVDAASLWFLVIEVIEGGIEGPALKYICRLNRNGRCLWRVKFAGRVFFMVYDRDAGCPVTVLKPVGSLLRKDKGQLIDLAEYL